MAILTKYVPTSNVKGSRVQVTMENGKRYMFGYEPELSSEQNHASAVVKALGKHDPGGRHGKYVMDRAPDNTPYAWVFTLVKYRAYMKIIHALTEGVVYPVPQPSRRDPCITPKESEALRTGNE